MTYVTDRGSVPPVVREHGGPMRQARPPWSWSKGATAIIPPDFRGVSSLPWRMPCVRARRDPAGARCPAAACSAFSREMTAALAQWQSARVAPGRAEVRFLLAAPLASSDWLERKIWDLDVGGSNPLPTRLISDSLHPGSRPPFRLRPSHPRPRPKVGREGQRRCAPRPRGYRPAGEARASGPGSLLLPERRMRSPGQTSEPPGSSKGPRRRRGTAAGDPSGHPVR